MDKTISVTCKICKKNYHVKCKKKDYSRWKKGEGFIQDLMSYLSVDDRELLISGNCGECFDKMFPSEDLDEDLEDLSSTEEEDGSDEEDEDHKLDLTHHEQDVMAEICSILASFCYKSDPTNQDLTDLGEKIALVGERCSSQFFGRLYDKFHRTGKNR